MNEPRLVSLMGIAKPKRIVIKTDPREIQRSQLRVKISKQEMKIAQETRRLREFREQLQALA